MKTAISISDDLFAQAEHAAQRLGVSRSRFYALALQNYLQAAASQAVTDKLNELYAEKPAGLEPAALEAPVAAASRKRLRQSEW
jgi:Arc/MetJ family transcription regulator